MTDSCHINTGEPGGRTVYVLAQHDEVTGLVNYIDEQLTAIRAAAFGLTEEQARQTPCRSALSVGASSSTLVEEWARHAGHADIIREQIDGVEVPTLVLTLAGASANDFFQPYQRLRAPSWREI
jgi:exosome complex RNA-binding protein Csl4